MVTVNSNNSSSSTSNNSTQLVETVSIDYDDFNDAFLTCATCLCVYDGVERAPKLLPCSHTVCLHCLTKIAAAAHNRRTAQDLNNGRNSSSTIQSSQQQESQQQRQTFRCPICRELIVVPHNGGVTALPPSFLVNQLLDLISTHRRRTLIPTCCGGDGVLSSHINQELLYCETCDQVFCSICTKHETAISESTLISSKSPPLVHTIIPVSVAMKRTSEIMLYKANECVTKLNYSRDGVCAELERLDTARNECLSTLDDTFNDLMNIIEVRKQQLQQQVHKAFDTKNRILSQQLSAIDTEKTKVMDECGNVHQLLDVQSINQRIQILNDRLQKPTGGIEEPRENAFIALDLDLTAIKNVINNAIGQMGRVRTTTTCPGNCTLDVAESNENLLIPRLVDSRVATLTAFDYDGKRRNLGGDPVTLKLIGPLDDIQQERTANNLEHKYENNTSDDGVRIIDHKNGQYTIRLRLSICGRYRLHIYVLGRPVAYNGNTGHIDFSVTKNIDPTCQYSKGPSMQQPVAIAIDHHSTRVYVLDTGNCRIRVLDTHLNYICDIQNIEAMRGRSSTGIGLLSDETLVTVNWRTNIVTQMNLDGETVKSWTHSSMIEPMCVVVDRIYDHVLIGDSSCNIHAFKGTTGQHLFTINNKKSNGKSAECVGTFMAIGPNSQIIVISSITTTGCRCLDIYSCKGTYERSITVMTTDKSTHSYSSLATCNNFILATRRHYNSYVIDLIDMETEKLVNTVDSNGCKLRRPAGMVAFSEVQDSVTDDSQQCSSYYLLVTDVAADSVKKYQFF
ncbi:uncharacterized protein LOC112603224 isoform X2 [Melanaphis sacchari]|uniref:uncharacterized protein LOC112603224 isoform X2 n=1 Tax=Melanaphis sacchari TaxID=742174 RepID=UPI000DC15A67|nr:uncharacterized protein LOC112603224 isoform X2 [Melanaphis sacchari]